MRFVVIIPVFNEEKTIKRILSKVLAQRCVSEIIVVDDGSRDLTREILGKIRNPKIKMITHKKNMGKGAAIQSALREVWGDYLIIQDADLEYDPSQYSLLLSYARPDVAVYGSRLLMDINKHAYFTTYLGNVFLTWIFNIMFGEKLTDSYTCYKLLPCKLAKSLKLSLNDFAIEAEITGKLAKKGIKIVEVPIKFSPRKYKEGKKIKAKDALNGLWTFLKIRLGTE